MISVRADVDADVAVMTLAGDPTARAARERVVQSSPKLLSMRDGAWGVGLCRFFSTRLQYCSDHLTNDGGGEVIGAVLKARKACGKATESLTCAWMIR